MALPDATPASSCSKLSRYLEFSIRACAGPPGSKTGRVGRAAKDRIEVRRSKSRRPSSWLVPCSTGTRLNAPLEEGLLQAPAARISVPEVGEPPDWFCRTVSIDCSRRQAAT